LKLIEVPDVDLFRAASDYLRASADRTDWAEQGYINPGSLDDFAEDLVRVWSNKKDKTLIGHSEKAPHLQGRLIYRDCEEHRASVDRLEAPDHFVRGSWHALADKRAIGWHPKVDPIV
jgi:hypothetical protein